MLIISALALLGLFILNISLGMYYGFGFRHYWFFQVLHVLGGFFVAMFFGSFFNSWTYTLAGLAVVTVSWESLEIALAVVPSWKLLVAKTFHIQKVEYDWRDGIFDVVCNCIGAFVFLYFFS